MERVEESSNTSHWVELDFGLIDRFRKVVNGNNGFVLNRYKDVDGKCFWNLICSCMDWISVSIRYIDAAPPTSKHIDVKTMQIYSLISAVDIVHESINQLHQVIFKPSDRGNPFKGDTSIFSHEEVNKDDNEYFKELRARFGAHPVNLGGENGERLFASWPYEGSDGKFDLKINLYSNLIEKADIHRSIGIRIEELSKFLICRYNYLNNLIQEVNRQYDSFSFEMKAKEIATKSNMLEQLKVLKKESNCRFNNDYYNGNIEDIYRLLSTSLTDRELEEEERHFKDLLIPIVEEIKCNLQNMRIIDLSENILEITRLPGGVLNYELEKTFSVLCSGQSDPLFGYFISEFNKFSNNKYKFSLDDNLDTTFLKLQMMLFKYN